MARTVTAPMADRYAVVTGATSGIGRAIALELATKGAAGIAITYARNKAAADTVIAELEKLGSKAVAIKADLNSPDFGDKVIKTALKELQTEHLHVIVNNAGASSFDMSVTFETSTKEAFDELMHQNVWGPILLIKAALPIIPPTGRIINISSAASRSGSPDPLMAYAASRAAMDSYTRSLATNYSAPKKITINSVLVGPTQTDNAMAGFAGATAVVEMLAGKATAEKRLGEPRDVANIVAFLASEESRWINGVSMPADGGSQLERQG